ncbi:DUF5956 family protein [Nocardioides caricicola]|uniref:DUF5956 family protein n=1 Tax=Nocardioides caricicola TaxID=634770 RepID=A0ABW0MZ03_9ACTN
MTTCVGTSRRGRRAQHVAGRTLRLTTALTHEDQTYIDDTTDELLAEAGVPTPRRDLV